MNIDNLKDYKIKNDYLYSLELIRLFYDYFMIFFIISIIIFLLDKACVLFTIQDPTTSEIIKQNKLLFVLPFFIYALLECFINRPIKRLRFIKNNDFYISIDNENIYFETYEIDDIGVLGIGKSFKKVTAIINKSDIVFRLKTKRPALSYSFIFEYEMFKTQNEEDKSWTYRMDEPILRILYSPFHFIFFIINVLVSYIILISQNGIKLKTYTIYQTKTKLVSLPFVDDLSVYFLYTEFRQKYSAISKGGYELDNKKDIQPLGEKYIEKQQKKIEKILNKKSLNIK